MKKGIGVICLFITISLALLSVTTPIVSAEVPTDSYTYWEDIGSTRKSVYNKPMYSVKSVISDIDLGVNEFTALNDVVTDKDGNVYILDSNSRIIVLDNEYKLLYEIGELDNNGETLNYSNAESIYVHTDGTIFISDTENARVERITKDGKVVDIYYLPDSSLIDKDFEFKPTHTVMDSYGYTYILSDGSYYGVMLFDDDKEFLGFFGANDVKNGISGVVKNIWNRMFPNNKKKSASTRTLPYCFVDVVIDQNDFLYTATGKTSTFDREGQIKKLSLGTGSNILDSDSVIFTDDEFNTTFNYGKQLEQDISGVAIDKDGFIYCMDATYGRIYLYDKDCKMITAFGGGMGTGTQDGSFQAVSGIALNGEDVIVSDSLRNDITVFTSNEYCKTVKELIKLNDKGEYEEAFDGWTEVLKVDKNLQQAYSGIARAYFAREEYKTAMEYAKDGYDRDTYALAFEMYRSQLLSENFTAIVVAACVLLLGGIAAAVILKRKRIKAVKLTELKTVFATLIHPANTFDDVNEKNQGSIGACAILVVLFYITAIMQVLCGGFLYTQYDVTEFNSVWVLIRSAGLVVLWIISNWMISTLLQGKGTLRKITIVTCYSLTPIIIARVFYIILSNVLLPSESVFLSGLMIVATLYFLLLMIIGLMKIHDYSMSRLIGTSLLTIFWMAALILIIILVVMLLQQLWGFIATLFVELFA